MQGNTQSRSTMPKNRKLPKFKGDGLKDPLQHCRTCETVWLANGQADHDEWVIQFQHYAGDNILVFESSQNQGSPIDQLEEGMLGGF